MKKILLSLILLIAVSACDSNFDELNVNPVSPTAINPVFQLNFALINLSFPTSTLIYEVGIVQQVISPNSGVLTGANYNQDNRASTQVLWQEYYRDVIRNTNDIINQTKDNPDRSNLYHMARILQAYTFLVLTDTYGDIPYFDAGKGFSSQIFTPAYDSQEVIYTDLIQELTQASAALDANKTIETADVLYAGNIAQWKKLGYSLLLRIGMRLSKRNQTTAQQVVQTAFQGGLMESNADNAVVRHDNNYQNGIGATLNSTEANNFYLTKPFVDFLKNTNDPRLSAIAVRYVGATSGPQQTSDRASSDPALQIGMPMGHDNTSVVAAAANDGLASFYDYSQVDRTRAVKLAAPMFLVTYAQTQLLLAEALQRGWISTGTLEGYYNNGVRAHMQQFASYDANSTISTDAIDAYLAANPFQAGSALQQINEQYWVASFLNGPEAFANFRRSGFPALDPNPFPGKDIQGDFIRRLTYPNSEISVNNANLSEAVSRMGADNLETRVWWDN